MENKEYNLNELMLLDIQKQIKKIKHLEKIVVSDENFAQAKEILDRNELPYQSIRDSALKINILIINLENQDI